MVDAAVGLKPKVEDGDGDWPKTDVEEAEGKEDEVVNPAKTVWFDEVGSGKEDEHYDVEDSENLANELRVGALEEFIVVEHGRLRCGLGSGGWNVLRGLIGIRWE